ncbi:glycosyltransferase family 4 protein [Tolypothrix sp. FACHB-123]|uniref:glycosyltransferase family 4 protein n=1 Tax=Tolypothrix sp. FACHB-123 TaxID=2692868 RepID=UPI001682D30D|nr:glycosyltransferase family 4 protein [Tolypothrix sp. FACHB-123]MBD2355807.1 glycosyltransferase family 4 protein [Tolypothrix sp. FACHB-123]
MSKSIIITYPRSLTSPGGGTRSCLQIAHQLQQMGNEVIIVSVSSDAATEKLKGKPVPVIPAPPSRLHDLWDGSSVAKIVKNLLTEKPVDAVLSWEHEAAFLPEVLKSKKIVFGMIAAHPSYTTWVNRQTGLQAIKRLSDRWFRWRLFKCADVIFVSSNFTRQELLNLFAVNEEKIKITHRGIDDAFSKVNRSPKQSVSNLIFYGSFAPPKGVFDAIAALGQVAAKGYKNWTLKLAGWEYEAQIKQAIREHQIESHVLMLGQLNTQELIRELEDAELAILPSRIESFGRAIAEAQASGLPVVSYDSGSIPEILENGVTGWLVPVQRVDLLANAIVEAMENPDKAFQMGMAGRDRVTQRFSWEQTAMAILQGIETAKHQSYNPKKQDWNMY